MPQNPASTDHVAETLIELQKRENDVVDDITKTEEEIERLQQILRERKSDKQQLERQKTDVFKGLSAEAAFDLGQRVERHSAKRQRLD
jgi:TolA-binding protein